MKGLEPDAVLVLGDSQYETGELEAYQKVYNKTWGRFKAITYPSVGNHEYYRGGGGGYFEYFGSRAGDPNKGYYSFDLGDWHLIALNSNCDIVACGADSPQAQWLREDLAAHPSECTLAFWHHPRFSSGVHGDTKTLGAFYIRFCTKVALNCFSQDTITTMNGLSRKRPMGDLMLNGALYSLWLEQVVAACAQLFQILEVRDVIADISVY